jgi:signal transduction histidine kinase
MSLQAVVTLLLASLRSRTSSRSTACSVRRGTCSALINDILDLSKIEAGRMELQLETFPLVPVIRDVAETIEPMTAKNDNRLIKNALPSFHSLAFTSDSLIVLAPKGSAWERRRSISVKELKRQVIVCREPGSSSRSAADRLIDTAGMPPNQVVQIGSREGGDSRGCGRDGAWH